MHFCDTCLFWHPDRRRICSILSGGTPLDRPPCKCWTEAPPDILRMREIRPDWQEYRRQLAGRLERDHAPAQIPADLP